MFLRRVRLFLRLAGHHLLHSHHAVTAHAAHPHHVGLHHFGLAAHSAHHVSIHAGHPALDEIVREDLLDHDQHFTLRWSWGELHESLAIGIVILDEPLFGQALTELDILLVRLCELSLRLLAVFVIEAEILLGQPVEEFDMLFFRGELLLLKLGLAHDKNDKIHDAIKAEYQKQQQSDIFLYEIHVRSRFEVPDYLSASHILSYAISCSDFPSSRPCPCLFGASKRTEYCKLPTTWRT